MQNVTGIKHIAIIGAGPTGIAFTKYFLAEKIFSRIDIFEQRDNVGGIWNLSGNERSKHLVVPQICPEYGATDAKERSLDFESPLYDYLETNIPKKLMAYSDFAFDEQLPLFPGHLSVLKYLENYAKPVMDLIKFHTKIIEMHSIFQEAESDSRQFRNSWLLTSEDLNTGLQETNEYDAVVLANGHYTVPHIPSIPGIAKWNQNYPNVIIHSKAYRRPEDFTGEKVLVIGNSASGLDIAAQLAPYAQKPVYLASRSASQMAPSAKPPIWRKDIPEVDEFLNDDGDRALRTKDGSIYEGFDTIIFATGYFFSFPFFESSHSKRATVSSAVSPSTSLSSADDCSSDNEVASGSGNDRHPNGPSASLDSMTLTTSGLRVHHLYKHFLHTEYLNLVIPVTNLKVIPFPLAENQAAVTARLWSGRLDLPPRNLMQAWEQEEEKRLLNAHRLRAAANIVTNTSARNKSTYVSNNNRYEGGFHTLVFPEDVNQLNSLYQWAATARRRDGLDNNGMGKLGCFRDEQSTWLRSIFPDIKAAFAKHGDNRVNVKDFADLGEEWVDAYEKWCTTTGEETKRELFHNAGIPGW